MNKRHVFWVLATLSVAIAIVSYRFLVMGLPAAFPDFHSHNQLYLLLHVSTAPLALAFGVFQFSGRLRARLPKLHRVSGRIYALAILISGLSGLAISLGLDDRPVAGTGFGLLAIIWLAVTANAIRLAVARDLPRHREWMLRSFALTLAAVSLRLQLPFLFIFGEMDYAEASNIVAWTCWLPNILIAEWYIRATAGNKLVQNANRF
ncbi:MAG: DUF2306 domain-containing protein [Rhodobacteraceae bacterium]|nr:DUF2306 domain-containing protein [Paracoccaceae bacterium]